MGQGQRVQICEDWSLRTGDMSGQKRLPQSEKYTSQRHRKAYNKNQPNRRYSLEAWLNLKKIRSYDFS
jgi:hypothetical protein